MIYTGQGEQNPSGRSQDRPHKTPSVAERLPTTACRSPTRRYTNVRQHAGTLWNPQAGRMERNVKVKGNTEAT